MALTIPARIIVGILVDKLGSRISERNVREAINGGRLDRLAFCVEEDRQPRAATILRDVAHVIEAHFERTARAGDDDTEAKHLAMFNRRAAAGQCFHQPCLGAREFPAAFAPVEGLLPPSELLPDQRNRDLGWMLYEEVKAAEIAFGFLADPRSLEETDRSEVKALGDVINLVKDGKPLENPERHLRAGTKLYVLGLSPHVARLSVRYWEATTLGAIGRAFHQHWRDLYMEPHGGRPPALHACALATAPAPARKQDSGEVKFSVDDIFPQLSGELVRAILSGARYPGALLPHLVMRIRSDHHVHRLRISLIKAAIVRAWRLDGKLPTEDYLVRSDPNDPRPARWLGRLFALLERAQLAALGDSLHAPIKDTYLGSAAATPALVFPVLVKSANDHLARLRRGHAEADWIRRSRYPQRAARRHGENLERAIGRLWAPFHDGLPSHLSTIDQGLFFVGYFQERFGGKVDPEAGGNPKPIHPKPRSELMTVL